MLPKKVVITDCYYENVDQEEAEMKKIGAQLIRCQCKTEEEVIEAVRDCDALICQFAPITSRVVHSLTKCRIIVRYAIGVDNIDLKAASDAQIYVCNVPDYSTDEVSNHAIALLLECAKKLNYCVQQVKEGVCSYTALKPLYRMQGKTLGLVGLGRIPRLVAKKMGGFGLHLIAYDPYIDPQLAGQAGVTLVSLEQLLRESDYISVHCPLTDKTRHLFDENAFCKMKKTCIFINTARGGVVSDEALVWALESGKIAMAGVDVTEVEPVPKDYPLVHMPNAIVTPHIAWYSEEALSELQLRVAQEVSRVLRGEKPQNQVNAF